MIGFCGNWVAFNPADDGEEFGWADIESAGLYAESENGPPPQKFFLVGDSCHHALQGKTAFEALRARNAAGEPVPACAILSSSEKPQRQRALTHK